MRVTDAAERLGVSRSTAHRLLAMLVYRDFAEQGQDRRYRVGNVLRPVEASPAYIPLLRRVCLPHLQSLTERVGESTNVMVLAGTEVRFIATVECYQPLRVGDRVGQVLPAHLASGGKALLATLPPQELAALYENAAEPVDLSRLRRQLGLVRKRGFAINDQQTETGLTALGMAIRDSSGRASSAVSIAMPTARFQREQLSAWVGAMSATSALVEHELGVQ